VETHNQTDHILIGKRQQSILTDVRSLKTAYSDTDLYLSVSKQTAQKFDMEKFNLKNLNDMEITENYRVKVSSLHLWKTWFILYTNRAWESI